MTTSLRLFLLSIILAIVLMGIGRVWKNADLLSCIRHGWILGLLLFLDGIFGAICAILAVWYA